MNIFRFSIILLLSLFLTGELYSQLPRQKVVLEEGTGTW